MNGRPSPLVPPPRMQQGGGAARPFGTGAPGLSGVAPGSRDAMIARLAAENDRGLFTERVFTFGQWDPLAPGGPTSATSTQSKTLNITTNRSSILRLVAFRGILQFADAELTGFETPNLLVSLAINGQEELTSEGGSGGPVSIASLCASNVAPWFWFALPPILRNGDTMQCTVTNNLAEGANLTPEISLRLCDDEWWQVLYGT